MHSLTVCISTGNTSIAWFDGHGWGGGAEIVGMIGKAVFVCLWWLADEVSGPK